MVGWVGPRTEGPFPRGFRPPGSPWGWLRSQTRACVLITRIIQRAPDGTRSGRVAGSGEVRHVPGLLVSLVSCYERIID